MLDADISIDLLSNENSPTNPNNKSSINLVSIKELTHTRKVIQIDTQPDQLKIQQTPSMDMIGQENPFNMNSGELNFFESTELRDNPKLDEETRRQMILKIIQVRQYVEQNNIQCDFEVLPDNSMYMNLQDYEIEDLFKKSNEIMESATRDSMPVLITTEEIYVDQETGEEISKEEMLRRQKEHKKQIVLQDDEIMTNQSQKPQIYMEAEVRFGFEGYDRKTVEKMMLMIQNEMKLIQIGQSNMSPEKQEQLNKVTFLGYDVSEHLANDLEDL